MLGACSVFLFIEIGSRLCGCLGFRVLTLRTKVFHVVLSK